MPTKLTTGLVALLSLVASAGSAQADAIEGNWCHPQHGNFEIRGPNILTPGGQQMTGDYSRHGFEYVAPAGERAAEESINLALVDDETLHLLIKQANAEIEVWRRCTVNVS